MLRAILLLLPLFLPCWAAAADTAVPGISAGTYAQAGLALALIVSLLVGAAWLARKVSGGKGFGQGGMRVIGGVALGPRERIVLLEVGEEWLVIGIVPGQIRTLHRLAKGELPTAEAAGQRSFAQWLHSIRERGNAAHE
ncbi:MAG: flagellar biosynthetic protein FliO [Azonexus sp.]|uniref:flagellar biosynthetic protein FliO n=1 Tax=Azonexus sp. TaxID=1872668 RepID=UPI002818D2E2|nr:flagellar biosynthetic protein FliO [Azonexus sp.]MDR0777733.1 flagellar biosynthetic protein FliO [Azonexus sp.]